MYENLENYFLSAYTADQYPALLHQREEWIKTKPLNGLSVVDATPLYRNSIYKYLNLIAAGAELYVSVNEEGTVDKETLEELQKAGIPTVSPKDMSRSYDIIMDCAALFRAHKPRIGFVELTRSRAESYENADCPVFMADGGRIKLIETSYGTGESFFRALEHLGHSDLKKKEMLLFGTGKVGMGILRAAVEKGMFVRIATDITKAGEEVRNLFIEILDYREWEKIHRIFKTAHIVVTATGQENALHPKVDMNLLINSNALVANMGALDEYGPNMPKERVLFGKQPLNFILKEPTLLKYMDATMALHNYGAVYILQHANEKGIILPPASLEDEILSKCVELPPLKELS